MENVAREAGIAKGTLFLYYKNKEELVLAIMIGWVKELGNKFDSILESSSVPEEKLRSAVIAMLYQFDRRRDMTGYSIVMPVSQQAGVALRELFAGNMKRISLIISECAAKGLLTSEDPLFSASAIFGLCRGSNVYARSSGRRLSVQERAERILNIFLNGTRKNK